MSETAGVEIHGDLSEVAYGCPVTYSRDQKVIHPTREQWESVAVALLNDGWNMAVDLTAADYLNNASRELPSSVKAERYEVVVNFISHERKERLRARIQVPADNPTITSIYGIFPGIDYAEREAYDMFGIEFQGHPDLSRILMPEEWEGHPLRKDYAIGSVPVQFKYPQGAYEVDLND